MFEVKWLLLTIHSFLNLYIYHDIMIGSLFSYPVMWSCNFLIGLPNEKIESTPIPAFVIPAFLLVIFIFGHCHEKGG